MPVDSTHLDYDSKARLRSRARAGLKTQVGPLRRSISAGGPSPRPTKHATRSPSSSFFILHFSFSIHPPPPYRLAGTALHLPALNLPAIPPLFLRFVRSFMGGRIRVNSCPLVVDPFPAPRRPSRGLSFLGLGQTVGHTIHTTLPLRRCRGSLYCISYD